MSNLFHIMIWLNGLLTTKLPKVCMSIVMHDSYFFCNSSFRMSMLGCWYSVARINMESSMDSSLDMYVCIFVPAAAHDRTSRKHCSATANVLRLYEACSTSSPIMCKTSAIRRKVYSEAFLLEIVIKHLRYQIMKKNIYKSFLRCCMP